METMGNSPTAIGSFNPPMLQPNTPICHHSITPSLHHSFTPLLLHSIPPPGLRPALAAAYMSYPTVGGKEAGIQST
jgi:hypothetical protein